MKPPQWSKIALTAIMGVQVACSQANADIVFAVGRSYRLSLRLAAIPALLPETAKYFAPIVDSAVLELRVDSTARDSVFATFSGDLRHFPVLFRSLGDSSVVMGEVRGKWRAVVSGRATDAGLELEGARMHDTLTGTWHALSSSPAHGEFRITPDA